jgi:hypothetical protein
MLHGARTVGATRKDDDGQRSQETARRARRYKPPGGELHRRRQLRRRGASCMASQGPVANGGRLLFWPIKGSTIWRGEPPPLPLHYLAHRSLEDRAGYPSP